MSLVSRWGEVSPCFLMANQSQRFTQPHPTPGRGLPFPARNLLLQVSSYWGWNTPTVPLTTHPVFLNCRYKDDDAPLFPIGPPQHPASLLKPAENGDYTVYTMFNIIHLGLAGLVFCLLGLIIAEVSDSTLGNVPPQVIQTV